MTLSTEGRTIRRARLYELSTRLLGGRVRALHRRVLEVAGITPGERVLDVGCGPGRLTLTAAEAAGSAGETIGIDPANLVLHHLPQELQRRGVAEVPRVLRPGGRFVVADFGAKPGHGVGHLLSVLGLRRGSDHAEHLRVLLGEAGFEAVQIETVPSGAFCVLVGMKPVAMG